MGGNMGPTRDRQRTATRRPATLGRQATGLPFQSAPIIGITFTSITIIIISIITIIIIVNVVIIVVIVIVIVMFSAYGLLEIGALLGPSCGLFGTFKSSHIWCS